MYRNWCNQNPNSEVICNSNLIISHRLNILSQHLNWKNTELLVFSSFTRMCTWWYNSFMQVTMKNKSRVLRTTKRNKYSQGNTEDGNKSWQFAEAFNQKHSLIKQTPLLHMPFAINHFPSQNNIFLYHLIQSTLIHFHKTSNTRALHDLNVSSMLKQVPLARKQQIAFGSLHWL